MTQAEIKARNLKHAQFIKARVNDSQIVASYVKFLDECKA